MDRNFSRNPNGILPHAQFKSSIEWSDFPPFQADRRSRVSNRNEFHNMQRHLWTLNDGIDAQHSFVDAAGQVFDCVSVEQQPSLRRFGAALPAVSDISNLATGLFGRPATTPPRMV